VNMNGIKSNTAKNLGMKRGEVSRVLDEAVAVIMEALIDSDIVHLDPLGSFELRSRSMVISDGNDSPNGDLEFSPQKNTLKFLIKENLNMIQLEEFE